MAESAVSFVVEKLANLLIEESIFLYDVHDQVVWIQGELQWMNSFLKDASAKQERDERIKKWVADIREAAYDAEDIIDTFIFKVASQRKQGFMGSIKRYACIFNKWMLLHKIGKQIGSIRTRLREISEKRLIYGIENLVVPGREEEGRSSSNERLRQLRRSSPYVADDEFVVGLEEETNVLIKELMKEEEQRCVMSIVGMGGLGKTTLARKIYNHSDIKGHFDCRAWVSVSKEYKTREILEGIIKNVKIPTKEEWEIIDRMTQYELERKVYELLEGRQYLVVLDDIWDRVAWDRLKNALPSTRNRSRIMLTTRNKEAVLNADVLTPPHELRCLNKDESWELFCRKAFPENNTPSCSPSLEIFGRAMVGRCDGLPLALVVLGGMLSRKNKLSHEWERMLKNIDWHLTEGPDGSNISRILGLSYNDLSFHLKSCFMHLGLFPEDYNINVTKLVNYWIVEGIVPQQGKETIEGVAEDCLNELINRSLVQVVKWTKGGRAKSCRVHDLLRDLSISKAKEENLLLEIIDENLDHEALPKSSRRCSVHSKSGFDRCYANDVSVSPQQQFSLHIRTLIFFKEEEFTFFRNYDRMSLSKEQMGFISRHFKFLRVLDTGSLRFKCLPKAIGNLIHLRYLSLNVSDLESEIPPSIGNLKNLQHVQLINRSMWKIPDVIWKLERLRYLHIEGRWNTSHLRIDTLRNLQYLIWVGADVWIGGNGSSPSLTNLVDLRIHGISSSHEDVIFHSFSRLNYLQSLWLHTYITFSTLAPLALCPRLLKLSLEGRIEKLIGPHEFPPNLIKLTLFMSNLKQESMVILGNLQNLRILLLHQDSYVEKELFFVATGFPQLKVLKFWDLDKIEDWRVENGALVMLKHLIIHQCRRLKMVPKGLEFLINLQKLDIFAMPTEFEDRLRGEDSYKVQHIQSITFEAF